jgi:hypothetical protein
MKKIIKGMLSGVFLVIFSQKTYASDYSYYEKLLEHENRMYENKGGAQREQIARKKIEEEEERIRQEIVQLVMERELIRHNVPFSPYAKLSLDKLNEAIKFNQSRLANIGKDWSELHELFVESQQLRQMPPTRERLQRIWDLEKYITNIESQLDIHH